MRAVTEISVRACTEMSMQATANLGKFGQLQIVRTCTQELDLSAAKFSRFPCWYVAATDGTPAGMPSVHSRMSQKETAHIHGSESWLMTDTFLT